jgi:uncharacterized membrane protein YkvA (DUF1232 family)
MLLAALAYFILPFDFIPDMIPGLGFTDDAAVLTAVFALVSESNALNRRRGHSTVSLRHAAWN